MQNHPDIFVAKEDKERAYAEYRYYKGLGGLSINGELKTYEYMKSSSTPNASFLVSGVDTTFGLFAGLTAAYPIYNAKYQNYQESARTSMDLSRIQSQKVMNDVVYNVKNSYYLYQMSQQNLAAREKILEKNKEKLSIAKRLFNSGQRPLLDVSKAEIGFNEAQLEFEKAKNNERQIRNNLYTAMGLTDTGRTLTMIPIEEVPEIKFTLEDLHKLGESYFPEIRIIKIHKRISKIKIDIEKAGHKPEVDVMFSLGFRNGGISDPSTFTDVFIPKKWEPKFDAAIRARISIYSSGAVQAKVDAAKNEYNKIIYKERDIQMNMKNMLRNLFNNLNEFSQQINTAKLIIKNAEKNMLLARKSYENGIVSQLELQDAEVSLINAQLGYNSAIYNYMNTIAKISTIVGLGEEALCKKK
ncbi:MAG: TolC family protein [Spirochaetes bacterium]|nr:TolC family protein [Spirochaetota bacterium]